MIVNNGLSDEYNSQVQALGVAIHAQIPVILWGNPGVGKSSVVYQLTSHYNIHCETVMANIREASDFSGLPAIIDNEVHFAPPIWVKNVQRAHSENKRTAIFYDEISTARPEVQSAMLRPILEGVVGDEKLPPNTITIGAANHPDMAAGGWDLSAPTANRFVHLDWKITASDIAYGLSKGWPPVILPRLHKGREEKVKEAQRLMAAFIASRPIYVNGNIPDITGSQKASDYAYPTSRSLSFASRLYGFSKSVIFVDPKTKKETPISREAVNKLLTGVIGEDAGKEFLDFVKKLDLPDPKYLLNNPNDFSPPKELHVLNAIIYSVEDYALHQTKEIDENIWFNWGDILVKILESGFADIAYASAKEWMRNRPPKTIPTKNQTQAFNKLFKELDDVI